MKEPIFYNYEEIVNQIWSEIKTNGVYTRSKNDFYDFVLYTLNKYDQNRFLLTNDNSDNEKLLKISATKIKNAKKNISVKFMNSEELEEIFKDFLEKIQEDDYLKISEDDNNYVFIIEDVVLRSILESKLKKLTQTTLNYKLNMEIVEVNQNAFIDLLAMEVAAMRNLGDEYLAKSLLADFYQDLIIKKTHQDLLTNIEKILEPDSIIKMGLKGLKVLLGYVLNKE